jgi:hypothetical protein
MSKKTITATWTTESDEPVSNNDYAHAANGAPIPQGYGRVQAALADIVGFEQARDTVPAWEHSRFSDSEALWFVTHGVIGPADVEQWQAATGLDRPVWS